MQGCKYLLLSKGKTGPNGNDIFLCKKKNKVFLHKQGRINYGFSLPIVCNSCEDFTPEANINNNENILKLFPFEEFRNFQKDVIIKACDSLSKGKNIILSAPTGFGKSAVNITICRHYNRSYYVVATKNLQDQIEENFGRYVSIMKGRSNYSCNIIKKPADRCIKLLNICPYGRKYLFCDNCNYPCLCKDCAYEQAKSEAERAQIVVTNISMLMTAQFLTKRDLIIVDEAHKLEDTIISNLRVTFEKDLFEIPYHDDFMEYIPVLQKYRDELEIRHENLLKEVKEEISEMITSSHVKTLHTIDHIEPIKTIIEKIDFILDDYKQFKEEWGMEKSNNKISFFPITAKRFLNKILDKGDRFVLSSATPPLREDLGSFGDNLDVISVSSVFPVENRPIYLDYVGDMSLSGRKKTIPLMAEKIKELAIEKTIVHCHSYKIAQYIARNLECLGCDCILQQPGRRQEDLERFKRGDCKIFLSVNMDDGISLDNDLCRVNILAKVPYPDFKDPQIQKRRKLEGDRFINIIVTRKISQAYGRATRSENDWSRFYILDSNFKFFFNKNKEIFPEWFKEAIIDK